MINLSDHVCGKCKHLNRYMRTKHGNLTDAYRRIQQQIDQDIQKNYYKMIPYYRRRLQTIMYEIEDVEKQIHPIDYLEHHYRPKVISIMVLNEEDMIYVEEAY